MLSVHTPHVNLKNPLMPWKFSFKTETIFPYLETTNAWIHKSVIFELFYYLWVCWGTCSHYQKTLAKVEKNGFLWFSNGGTMASSCTMMSPVFLSNSIIPECPFSEHTKSSVFKFLINLVSSLSIDWGNKNPHQNLVWLQPNHLYSKLKITNLPEQLLLCYVSHYCSFLGSTSVWK